MGESLNEVIKIKISQGWTALEIFAYLRDNGYTISFDEVRMRYNKEKKS